MTTPSIRTPLRHDVKAWPAPFAAAWSGRKPYEVRPFDRDYQIGDQIIIREWEPSEATYTGREIEGEIDSVVRPGEWGLLVAPNVGVFGYRRWGRTGLQPSDGEAFWATSHSELCRRLKEALGLDYQPPCDVVDAVSRLVAERNRLLADLSAERGALRALARSADEGD